MNRTNYVLKTLACWFLFELGPCWTQSPVVESVLPEFLRLNNWKQETEISVFAFCGVFEEANGDGDKSEEVDEYEEAAPATQMEKEFEEGFNN